MTVGPCLEWLDRAIDAARTLGIGVDDAAAVLDDARRRLGFPTSVYVLALAGGTGVGKSSLLNGLARREVSPAGARRPTTNAPVAWVPSARVGELRGLLEWLDIETVREHGSPAVESVEVGGAGATRTGDPFPELAVVDLPDLDSIAPEHRQRVDELLPRIDAVLWVSDPEKYQDALLHDDYLRTWAPRLDRQAVLLNKTDRVRSEDAERLRGDLRARLRAEGLGHVDVLLTSAAVGGGAGLDELERWLHSAVDAKRIVAGRVAAEARSAVASLAVRAGVDPQAPARLVPDDRRSAVLDDVAHEALAVVDPVGLQQQAIAATRLAARPRGGGPLGLVVDLVYRASGRAQVVADPSGYARRWRARGSLVPATEPLRRLVAATMPRVPPQARPALAAVGETSAIQARLTEAIDRAVSSDSAMFEAPTSRVWPLVGAGQYVATGALVLGVVWLVALWAGVGGTVPTLEVPLLGAVPLPVVLVVGGVFAGFLLGRLLSLHAAMLGRGWARRLREAVAAAIRARLDATIMGPLDDLEAARESLAQSAAGTLEDCAAGVDELPATPAPLGVTSRSGTHMGPVASGDRP